MEKAGEEKVVSFWFDDSCLEKRAIEVFALEDENNESGVLVHLLHAQELASNWNRENAQKKHEANRWHSWCHRETLTRYEAVPNYLDSVVYTDLILPVVQPSHITVPYALARDPREQ